MKKNDNKKTNQGNKASQAPARMTLKWRETAAIMADKEETENKVVFDLVERQAGLPTVTLTLYPSDNDYDGGILNLFGVSIRVIARAGASGMFLSLPSHKAKDGKYYDDVTVYDKNFHACVKAVLAAYYNDAANE